MVSAMARSTAWMTVCLAVAGCGGGSSAMTTASPDNSEAFLVFGRGSGMDGLETVSVSPDGQVTVVRITPGSNISWQRAEFRLSQDEHAALSQLVTTHHLADLGPRYAADVMDGTQWILMLREAGGDDAHVVYCDNAFPPEVERFATELDVLLRLHERPRLTWNELTSDQAREHAAPLWDAVTPE